MILKPIGPFAAKAWIQSDRVPDDAMNAMPIPCWFRAWNKGIFNVQTEIGSSGSIASKGRWKYFDQDIGYKRWHVFIYFTVLFLATEVFHTTNKKWSAVFIGSLNTKKCISSGLNVILNHLSTVYITEKSPKPSSNICSWNPFESTSWNLRLLACRVIDCLSVLSVSWLACSWCLFAARSCINR